MKKEICQFLAVGGVAYSFVAMFFMDAAQLDAIWSAVFALICQNESAV